MLALRLIVAHPLGVRNLKTSVVLAAMLATTHAFAPKAFGVPISHTGNLQAAEAAEQETVNLTVSGMV